VAVTHRDGLPANRRSPIQVLTGPDVPNGVTTMLNHFLVLSILHTGLQLPTFNNTIFLQSLRVIPKILYIGFPATCCRLVSNMTNKSTISRCNGIWETTRHNRHTGLLPMPTYYRLVVYVVDLLRTCYWEIVNLLRTCFLF